MALRRVVTPVNHTCIFNGAGERFSNKPWGLFGGQAGESGQFLMRKERKVIRLDDKPEDVKVSPGTYIIVETPGAGGYGPPAERSKDLINQDRESGKFSIEYINRHYEN